jgi:hypothetical protein
MALGKWVKKKSAQATKAAGKRYGMSYGRKGLKMSKQSLSKIAKDVMMIKSQLNVEKKYVDTYEIFDYNNVGQVRDNADGRAVADITPSIAQGVAEAQRVGNSIKATGMVLKFNMVKQSQAEGTRRVRIYIVRSLDPNITPGDVHNRILDGNPFAPVRDYNSNLDYTQFKDGRLKIIAKKDVYFAQNSGDGLNNINNAEAITKSVTIPIKLNQVLRYESNASVVPENIRYHAVMVSDNGNAGSLTSSILGIFVTQSASGIDFKANCRFWYVDN